MSAELLPPLAELALSAELIPTTACSVIPQVKCWIVLPITHLTRQRGAAGTLHEMPLYFCFVKLVRLPFSESQNQPVVCAPSCCAALQSAPMVAAFWGVCVFKEFKGAPAMSWALMGAMFLFYIGTITCIAWSARIDSESSGGTSSTNTTNTTFSV